MSFIGKLKFWKKEDDFDFDKLTEKEISPGGSVHDDLGLDQKSLGLDEKSMFPEEENAFPSQGRNVPLSPPIGSSPYKSTSPSGAASRDLELINSKLDTVKALLNSLDQRMSNLERASTGEKKQTQRLW